MKEVVKKEVIKWLDASIIFPISDSNWVIPVQCVPKRRGVIVVENEKNKLIPSLIMTRWRVCIDNRRLNKATRNDHFSLLFIDQMMNRLLEKDVTFKFDRSLHEDIRGAQREFGGYPLLLWHQIGFYHLNLCTEFDVEIRDRKGTKNQVVDHLSRLKNHEHMEQGGQIKDTFSDEQLFAITHDPAPWYTDYVNYIVSEVLPPKIQSEARKRFLYDVTFYHWNEPFLYRQYADQLTRRCIPENEVELVLYECHASPYEGHHGGDKTTAKVLQYGFY
ncbi:uncharacterized protein LOC142174622 [Nicotiana tabacum]|uniref:Uncharacterized protein LOC142174622 n=1 Tax=Nicotiana tabacum TaxID=4097 RepID=A0AC58TH58_TOBAC